MPASDTRQRIWDAASQLFHEKGYNDATVAEIIESAQTNKGSFYHHFEDKQHLAYDICMSITNSIEAQVKELYPGIETFHRLFMQEAVFWRAFFNDPALRRFTSEVFATSYVSIKADVFDAILDHAPANLSNRDLLMVQGLELAMRGSLTAYAGMVADRLIEGDFVSFYLRTWLGTYGIEAPVVDACSGQAAERLDGLIVACSCFTVSLSPAN